jgi:hypothetical protein
MSLDAQQKTQDFQLQNNGKYSFGTTGMHLKGICLEFLTMTRPGSMYKDHSQKKRKK